MEEGNTIIFTRLIIRFHLPTSIERQAGRQAGRHARMHARGPFYPAACSRLRFKALSIPPRTNRFSGFGTKYQTDFFPRYSAIDTKLSTRLRACVRNEDARAKEHWHLRSREARKPSVCFSFHVGKRGPFEDPLFTEKFWEERVGIRTVFTVRYRPWFKLSGEERGRIRGVSINPIQFL